MAREIMEFPDDFNLQSIEKKQQKEYDITVVTNMFGGGVQASKNDLVSLIHGTTIRGHLRFWWRATRGAVYEDVEKLRERESEIFGSTKNASAVSVTVNVKNRGEEVQKSELKEFQYILFPFEKDTRSRVRIKFTLGLSFPDELKKDVEAAVWAWINFGGIGARTRRGCGALYCKEVSPKGISELENWYKEKCQYFEIKAADKARDWPTLPEKFLKNPSNSITKHKEVWREGVKQLKIFRQDRNPGRESNKPGRSKWPEADSIRRITGNSSGFHKVSITGNENKFPRADFGLPIHIQFKQDRKDLNSGDSKEPGISKIVSLESERMASPLLIKPLAISETDSLAIVMCLCVKPLQGIKLKATKVFDKNKDTQEITRIYESNDIVDKNLNSPKSLNKYSESEGSAVQAFLLNLEKERKFQWVKNT